MHNLIKERRSVREYTGEAIDDAIILEIVKAAMQAPSAKNQQPWLIHIEKNKDVILKMADEFPNLKFGKDASCVLVFLMKTDASVMAPQDMASCVTMALLEAENQKVGACWGGVYPRVERMDLVRKVFNLNDESYVPFALVPLGTLEKKDAYRFIDRFSEDKLI